jgi:DNA-directed RNA polymerase specialized sigma24 family protein
LCVLYRQPIYEWLRASGLDPNEAEDATHDLVEHLYARGTLASCRQELGRFRQDLLTVLRNLLHDQHVAKHRQKRGGQSPHVPLDCIPLAAVTEAPEQQLDREFARAVHDHALRKTRELWRHSGREARCAALEGFIFHRPMDGEYASAATALGLTAIQVKRSVFDLREDYFNAFRHTVAQTVTPEELAPEIQHLVKLLVAEV